MKTHHESQVDTTPSETIETSSSHMRMRLPGHGAVETVLVLGLILVALIPRILLALQLDMVTDEVVYILGGKIYFPLLTHLQIGASGWMYNYEHPPFVKFLIGFSLWLNAHAGHPLKELFAARLPSIITGTLLVVAIYWLGRAPFGRVIALLAALCLAVSPWLVYFSALAYLDTTMTACITIAYLLVWHVIRRPWLYVVIAILVGLGAASKYTAVLVVPSIILFTAYYFFVLRFYVPKEQRPGIPWLWWIAAVVLSPLAFLAVDLAIWPSPIRLLIHSFTFEWNHSNNGHLTFFAGHYSLHVPHWAILYIVFVKMSAFVTIPAAGFAIYACIQLVRFHMSRGKRVSVGEATTLSFLLIWLIAMLIMFGMLNIVVGTHYHIPLAAPVALSGAFGLVTLFRYHRGSLFALNSRKTEVTEAPSPAMRNVRFNPRAAIVIALLTLMLVGPHLFGLTTVYGAEGYTSEFFHGEDSALQVAYPGYREAAQWIAGQTHGPEKVGLVALIGTLSPSKDGVSWYDYNNDLPKRLQFSEAHPDQAHYSYDYLVWPMHLIQRGYRLPASWRSHIVHVVMGGATVYCYVLARPT